MWICGHCWIGMGLPSHKLKHKAKKFTPSRIKFTHNGIRNPTLWSNVARGYQERTNYFPNSTMTVHENAG